MKYKSKKLRATLKEGEYFDEQTKHKFFEDKNGEIVEMKYCSKCKKWKKVSNFSKSTQCLDGLQGYCKHCCKKYRERYTSINVNEYEAESNNYLSTIQQLRKELSAANEEKERIESENRVLIEEKTSLQEKCVILESQTITITERDVEEYLKTHLFDNDISPRVLLSAVHAKESRYQFICKDLITGFTHEIKYES